MTIRDPLMPDEPAELRQRRVYYTWAAIFGIAVVAAILAILSGPREPPTITVTVPVEIEYSDEIE